jgi:effector-binding domain-containing protein
MADEPRIEQRDAVPYLAIAIAGPTADLQRQMDEAFPDLFGRLEALGIAPAGAPFIRYGVFQPEGRFALDVAVPVADGSAGDDRLRAGELPAGDYAVHLHRGAYTGTTPRWEGRDLAAAHTHVHMWADRAGLAFPFATADDGAEEMVAVVERYLVGPPLEDDVEKWETELAYLLTR